MQLNYQNKEEKALVESIIYGIQEKKGNKITILDLSKLHNRVTDKFIICEGNSNTQVEAIADSIEYEVKKATGERPYHTEGYENAEWILLDYVNVVVHVFQPAARQYYNLEALWADANFYNL